MFSRRIGATIKQDTKKILAADLQIQAWRHPEAKVIESARKIAGVDNVILQSDFLTTAFFHGNTAITVSVRALEGAFPFYGTFRTQPQLPIESLRLRPSALVDISLQERGYKLGDHFQLGKTQFEIVGFLLEEAQTVASALAAGPRVIIHQNHAFSTGLIGKSSRIFNVLLVRTELSPKDFTQLFRKLIPDPHWRIITPNGANAQAEQVINRVRGLLSLVALVGVVLGAMGVFVVFRSQFFLQLPQFGALRCLGLGKTDLLAFLICQGATVLLIGVSLGTFGGVYLENLLNIAARSAWGVNLVEIPLWPSALLSLGVSALTVGLATLMPAFELVKVPILQAIRNEVGTSKLVPFRQAVGITLLASILCVGISRDLVLSSYFMVLFTMSALLLGLIAWGLLTALEKLSEKIQKPFVLRMSLLSLCRQKRAPLMVFVCLGLGVFLVSTVLFVSHSLKEQIHVSRREGIPNLVLLGVTPEMRNSFLQEILPSAEWTPTTLARIENIRGEKILENQNFEENVLESKQRLRTREYTITRRLELAEGEALKFGEKLFGIATQGLVRASLEEKFAERIGMKMGDHFLLSIGGVPVKLRVDSLRKVKWNNFKPNFFIVVNAIDLQDAPMDFVGIARVPSKMISEYQQKIAARYPEITVLNAQSISQRLMELMDQLGLAVQSVGLFSLGSCILVFLGILMSQRQGKLQELALLRTLGLRSWKVRALFILEILSLAAGALLIAFILAFGAHSILNKFYLDIPIEEIPYAHLAYFYASLLIVLTSLGLFMFRGLLNEPPLRVLRETDEA